MTHTYKRIKLDPEKFQDLKGSKIEVELPKDAVLALWVEWYCSSPVVVSLVYATGLVVPYAVDAQGSFALQTLNLLSVLFEKDGKSHGVGSVQVKDLAVREKGNWAPVEIAPPPPLTLQLSSLIDTQVKAQLERMGVVNEKIDISDEDNLEEDVDQDEFGGGYMEDEEPTRKGKRKAKAADKPVEAGNTPAPGKGAGDDPKHPGSLPDSAPSADKA